DKPGRVPQGYEPGRGHRCLLHLACRDHELSPGQHARAQPIAAGDDRYRGTGGRQALGAFLPVLAPHQGHERIDPGAMMVFDRNARRGAGCRETTMVAASVALLLSGCSTTDQRPDAATKVVLPAAYRNAAAESTRVGANEPAPAEPKTR